MESCTLLIIMVDEDEVREGILGRRDSSALVGDHETFNLKKEVILNGNRHRAHEIVQSRLEGLT